VCVCDLFLFDPLSSFGAQGALLLVDCIKGVQAQTVANFWLAFEQVRHMDIVYVYM